MKHKKLKITILMVVILIAICLILPPTRSYAIMSIYSASENSKSVMHENDFKIKVPSSKGWYPFVMTFNTGNFGRWSGTDADMSIMYNFAEFKLNTLSSDIFNPKSNKHSSFYGAYALQQPSGYFGYNGDEIDIDEIVLTFQYDYKLIVLKDLGCVRPTFQIIDTQITKDVEYLNMDGWTKIDAVMETNAMLHNYTEHHTSYMQYGKPKSQLDEDFPVIKMYGRLYIKAFEEYNSTIIVYVMSPNKDVITECDIKLLQNIKIKDLN